METTFVIWGIVLFTVAILLVFSQILLDYINRNKEKVKYLKIHCDQLSDIKNKLDKILVTMEKDKALKNKNQPLAD